MAVSWFYYLFRWIRRERFVVREKGEILSAAFFARPTLEVAAEFPGKFLVRRFEDGREQALVIHEVEAYDGPEDLASHASRGMTPRTSVMFGEPGVFYVYLCYGVHWLVNIVTGPVGFPAAVLIRGAGEFSGPGRLTKGIGIDGRQNGKNVFGEAGVWFEDRGVRPPAHEVMRLPRVGVDYAGPDWSARPYRFLWVRKSEDSGGGAGRRGRRVERGKR